ncbi:prolipoprotein diacylglyceryl transferase family protein, partial [Escherichia coli]
DPVDAFKVTNGGLGIWGAVALSAVALWVMFRIKKIPLAPFADAVAPGLILAQGIGRLGNWFNQELYGRPTDVPWALDIYYRVDEAG